MSKMTVNGAKLILKLEQLMTLMLESFRTDGATDADIESAFGESLEARTARRKPILEEAKSVVRKEELRELLDASERLLEKGWDLMRSEGVSEEIIQHAKGETPEGAARLKAFRDAFYAAKAAGPEAVERFYEEYRIADHNLTNHEHGTTES